MSFPSEEQLREWWADECKFSQTELGRMFNHMKHQFQVVEHERDVYRRVVMEVVMDWASTVPNRDDVRAKIERAKAETAK